MFWNTTEDKPFELSIGTKAILFVMASGVLFFGIGYALRPVSDIIDDIKDKELKLEDKIVQ